MRILWIAPYAPYPPDTGGRQRIFHLVRGCLEAGHSVDLWCVDGGRPPYPEPPPRGLTLHPYAARARQSTVAKARALCSPLPEIAWAVATPTVRRDLGAAVAARGFDVAVFEHAHAGALRAAARSGAPVLLDAHNVEWTVVREAARRARRWRRRLRFTVDAAKLKRLEGALVRSVDACAAVSTEDATLIGEMTPRGPVWVHPNGVDLETIRWADHTEPGGTRLLMTGHLGYLPNIDAALWAADALMPAARARIPGAVLTLAGRHPAEDLDVLRGRQDIRIVADPADMSACFAEADVFFAPLRFGSGTRIKVLEALAAGLPVVGTPEAVSGLDVERRGLALVGRTAAELVEALERARSDREFRRHCAEEGRAYVAETHDWRKIAADFEQRLATLAGRGR
jgi:glycosyltransferase involved in cell wall biosynthesis